MQTALQRRVGERIRAARKRRGWSQEKLGEESGLHWTYVGSVERGERNLTLQSLHTLAAALGTTMAQLLEGIG